MSQIHAEKFWIRGLSTQGFGITEGEDGKVIFVEGAWPGDWVTLKDIQEKKNFRIARVLDVLSPSLERRVAPCPYQGTASSSCGGCSWMMGTYRSQLAYKHSLVLEALRRARLLSSESPVKDIWPSEREWGYRSRAQFKVNGQDVGFVAKGLRKLVPVKECLVLNEGMNSNLKRLWGFQPQETWRPQPPYEWNFIDVCDEDDFRSLDSVRLNKRQSFQQGNKAQNERMRQWVYDALLKCEGERGKILELFSGDGNFTEVILRSSPLSLATVEVSQDARLKLKQRHPEVSIFSENLMGEDWSEGLKKCISESEIVVLDPPREGFSKMRKFLELATHLKWVLSVSCDVASFVRDSRVLKQFGFEIQEVQPLDMFPHTPHVETLSLFQKTSALASMNGPH